jgi:hypothetical protein
MHDLTSCLQGFMLGAYWWRPESRESAEVSDDKLSRCSG